MYLKTFQMNFKFVVHFTYIIGTQESMINNNNNEINKIVMNENLYINFKKFSQKQLKCSALMCTSGKLLMYVIQ